MRNHTLPTRHELYDAWIAGYEAAAGVGFFNERLDGLRGSILERFEKWLRERDEAVESRVGIVLCARCWLWYTPNPSGVCRWCGGH